MRKAKKEYACIPFWSWNDELDENELVRQVEWMNENGVGGFFMHARGGLKTEYLGEKWFSSIDACSKRAKELGMHAYAYDENGWPSGFAGGKLLEDIENRDRYLTYTIGDYDEKAHVSYSLDSDRLMRVNSLCPNCLNVYEHYSASTADILNPDVVDKFIALTHEQYRKRDKHSLKGFFTDEPQFYRWNTPYTKMIPKYFSEVYGEDVLDGLGLLFVEKEGYRAFRYKFWKAMQTLMLENFAKKIYDWCDKYGYKLTGHYIEECRLYSQMWCCGGIMPFYEYEHIPGIDYLGKNITNTVAAKQVSSASAQLGKKQVMTETFACCGWDISPNEVKLLAEAQYVGGINLMCQHLLPYREHGQRKRDYPAHYSSVNPWVRKNFKEFNDYFSILGELLAESEEVINVGVLHPIRSAYFDYKRFPTDNFNGVGDVEKKFHSLTEMLTAKAVPFHYIDEVILAKYGKLSGSKLTVGKCSYDYIIIPKILTMDKSTDELLSKYVKAGGKLLMTDSVPEYLEGEKHSYDYLSSNVTLEEIIDAQAYKMTENKDVRTSYRRRPSGEEFIYAVNVGSEAVCDFTLPCGKSFKKYDIITDKYTNISTRVKFSRGESLILYITDEVPEDEKRTDEIHLGAEFTLSHKVDNFLTLDKLSYSEDGINYTKPFHHTCIFNEMLTKRYTGKLYLKYSFDVDVIPEGATLLIENTNLISVSLNGRELSKIGSSDYDKELLEYDAENAIKEGKNEVVILINYYQKEDVYYALFGENVTESLRNCLVYDTDIEPIYLKGIFGVSGDFKKGKKENVIIGENFRVVKQEEKISSLIEDGFPFFSGDITLKQSVISDGTPKSLVIDGRFHLIDVSVNGKPAGRMMFAKKLDISDFLARGENEIEITLTVGNRNLLGPFHTEAEEPDYVSPALFERLGKWKNGKCEGFVDAYAFVKTII